MTEPGAPSSASAAALADRTDPDPGGRTRRRIEADAVVVGSGVAGLSAVLELVHEAPGARVILVTRGALGRHGASPLAQGGVAAAVDAADSPALHAEDTAAAGAGLGRREVVEILTRDGPGQIERLVAMGARFDRDASGALALGLEGAHSRHRILHADGDRTGAEVTRALREAVAALDSIQVFERSEAIELVSSGSRADGILIRDGEGGLVELHAPHVVLATGGPGRAYLRTTAPPGLDGDGLAMAARAGAALRDLEFVQFHPTALNVEADPLPLVTEALRGAGAHLVDGEGRRLLAHTEIDELAPRDLVARAIWTRIRRGDRVFLDARESPGDPIADRFPGVYRLCRKHGVDPAREPIPVTPAAHYHMGGIEVDPEGRSTVTGLWAVGEVASSGVHGANRLASNSLLEGLVFGARCARAIVTELRSGGFSDAWPVGDVSISGAHATTARLPIELERRIRTLMWDNVGVVRSAEGLSTALEELDSIRELQRAHGRPESANLLLTARLITSAALARRESLGSHYRSDHPRRDVEGGLRHSVTRLLPEPPGRIECELVADTLSPSAHPPVGRRPQAVSVSTTRERPDAIRAH